MTPAFSTTPASNRLRASIALLFASSSLILAGCNDSQSAVNTAPKDPEVGVVTLAPQSTTLKSELAGRTAAQMVAQIRPQVSGIVQKRAFTEGAMVKAGELLYQIDPASYQSAQASAKASLARAEATAAAARLKAKRQADLFAIEAISQQDNEDAQTALQQAEADVASARAALETASINLERTRIVSPIAGRVEASTVTPGALVTANQTAALTQITQLDPMHVDITQSSTDVLRLQGSDRFTETVPMLDAALQVVRDTVAKGGRVLFVGTKRQAQKAIAEAALLRKAKQPQAAFDLLDARLENLPDNAELLYETALLAERLDQLEIMERRLRRLIELQPEHGQAYNALGYSFADRGIRLPEARELIDKALALMPNDTFILDSLGWVQYRQGDLAGALATLERAYGMRDDPEIGAHLGEVLWAIGRKDDAQKLLRAAQKKHPDNEPLADAVKKFAD